ncbi:PAS domain-containing protein [Desulforhopalus singaporensis]|uniref:PAS domain S-box-containing protein n=1 Tax=Desulforhopalus singaporensis TaxID=91360 RepID=A0A1H0S5A8_9BACT|nr:PAS domain-containing protein [Desulforhopalus singaporensis]SDP36827.1 PAS domain S-box-containing protein [Desulforhopalus singaporensis]
MQSSRFTGIVLTVQFAVFIGAVIVVSTTGQPDAAGWATLTTLLGIALFCCVLLTFYLFYRQQQKRVEKLNDQLALEKKANHNLRWQFDQSIEKRTLELQMVNGALHREIAERIQAEQEACGLQKQFNLILDSAGEGILGLDNQGRVIFVNRAAALMLDREVEELLGNTHHELIHHTHPDGTVHPVEQCPIYMAYRDGQVHYKSGDVFWCKNGSSFPVEYVSTPIRENGMLTGAVVVFRDMNTYK